MTSRLKLSLAAATILTASSFISTEANARESYYNLRNQPPQIIVNLGALEDLKPRRPIENEQILAPKSSKRPNSVKRGSSVARKAAKPAPAQVQEVVAPYDSRHHERGAVAAPAPTQTPARPKYTAPKLTGMYEDPETLTPPAPPAPAAANVPPIPPAPGAASPAASTNPFNLPSNSRTAYVPVEDGLSTVGTDRNLVARKIAEAKARTNVVPAPDAVIAPPPAPELKELPKPELKLPEAQVKAPELPKPELKAPEIKAPELKAPEMPKLEPLKAPELPKIEPLAPAPKANLTAPVAPAPLPPVIEIPKAPELKAPEIKAPELKAPELPKPELKAPELKAPEIKAPELPKPEPLKAPELKAPELPKLEPLKAPELKAPELPKAPELKAPELKAPELPKPEAKLEAPKLPAVPVKPINDTNEVVTLPAPKLDLPPPPAPAPLAKPEANIELPKKPSVPEQPSSLSADEEKKFEEIKQKMAADEAKLAPIPKSRDEVKAVPAAPVTSKNLPPLVLTQKDDPQAITNKSTGVKELPPLGSLFDKNAAAPATPTAPVAAVPKLDTAASKEMAALTPPAAPAIPPAPPVPGKPNLDTVVKQSSEVPATAPNVSGKTPNHSVIYGEAEIDLPPTEKTSLEGLISQLNADKNARLTVVAYASGTPDQASAARRTALHRALKIREYLMDRNIPAEKIDIRPLGNKVTGGVPDRVDVFVDKSGNS